MTPESYTFTKDGITLTTWPSSWSIGKWLYYATHNGLMLRRGTVEAFHRIDAWDKAFEEVKQMMEAENG